MREQRRYREVYAEVWYRGADGEKHRWRSEPWQVLTNSSGAAVKIAKKAAEKFATYARNDGAWVISEEGSLTERECARTLIG